MHPPSATQLPSNDKNIADGKLFRVCCRADGIDALIICHLPFQAVAAEFRLAGYQGCKEFALRFFAVSHRGSPLVATVQKLPFCTVIVISGESLHCKYSITSAKNTKKQNIFCRCCLLPSARYWHALLGGVVVFIAGIVSIAQRIHRVVVMLYWFIVFILIPPVCG